MQEEKTPKVSVCVVTYNQEKNIRQCLQSIVDQQTDFYFEVIVGDDCSTDGTKAIVQEFAKKYPDVFKPVFHETNLGAFKNYRYVHSLATGKYVAHVDGDDSVYPGKLMKQSQFLDANENCNLVAHRMAVFDGRVQVAATKQNPGSIDLTELLLGHPMFLNSSIMYRREKVGDVFLLDADFIDFYVYVWTALRGDIGFIDEILCKYSRNVGISSKRNLLPYIDNAIDLAQNFAPSKIIDVARSRQYLAYAISALMARDDSQFIDYITSARAFNKKSFVIFCLFSLKKLRSMLRLFVLGYKKSRLLAFRFGRIFTADCHD